MKLCLVANPNSIHTRRWIKYLHQQDLEIHLIGEHTLQRSPPDHCTFYDLTSRTKVRKVRYLIWSQTVRQLVRQIKPDILHAISITSAGWLAAAANYHPYVATAIGSDLMLLNERSFVNRWLSSWALKRADYVTCVSKDLANKASQLGVEANNIEVTYTGVDLRIFHPAPENQLIRAQLNLANAPLVLSIRAITPIYNPLDIARAIPLVVDQIPEVKFIIFTYNSDPVTLNEFKEMIQRENVQNSVIFVDPISDETCIAEFYREADIAISVPSSDGTPASVLEAMACGTAVIASDLPSITDWITSEQNGLIVPVHDVTCLANAILRLLRDVDLREKLGANAAAKMQQQGDNLVWAQQMLRIYRELSK